MTKKQILVVGLGKSGQAATSYLIKQGYHVTGVDKLWNNPALIKWKRQFTEHILQIGPDDLLPVLENYDGIIVSPGIPQTHPIYQQALKQQIPLIGEAQLAFEVLQKQVCIGITGSNGKTTTTLFLEYLFRKGGYTAQAIGNVGVPFCEYLMRRKQEDVLLCELSSYQLETLSAVAFDVVILLQISENHLDRYPSFKHYVQAKLKILECMKPSGIAFVHHTVLEQYPDEIAPYLEKIIVIPRAFCLNDQDSYLQLQDQGEYCGFVRKGQENGLGFEVAFLGWAIAKHFHLPQMALIETLETFRKPAHRIEHIGNIQGVGFINDSKATTPEAVVYAVNVVGRRVKLIVGGRNKDLSFFLWQREFGLAVIEIFAIGESALLIQQTLQGFYDVTICEGLEKAVHKAFETACPGDTILLSPGCASFDQYRDYMHRGDHFKEIVIALQRCVR